MTNYPDTRQSLIVQVKNTADQAAWEEFVRLYQPVIYRTAIQRGLQDADAHDLTQQVLVSVAGAVARWKPDGPNARFRHWLRRITRNAIVNAVTRARRDQAAGSTSIKELLSETPQRDSRTEELIQLEYRRELLLQAAKIVREVVDEPTWKAFELTAVKGVNKTEAAKQLGKSIGAIYAARSRVLKRIRNAAAELEESQR